MSEKKISYGEYVILGINKGLTAFLFSFVVCLLLSLVINLHFYQEITMLTVGSLGDAGSAGSDTILRTAGLLLGLSFFQTSGKFQLGLLLLAVIPLVAFLVAGLLFRIKKPKDSYVNLISSVIIDVLAAVVYALFLFIAAFLTKGMLFGVQINFASGRNFLFSLMFAIFVQFILGINRHKQFTNFTAGLLKTRNLLWLTLGFSALTGVLFMLYYLMPYLKSLFRILAIGLVLLPNLAVYLTFLLMGVPLDLADSLGTLSNYLHISPDILILPVGIRVQLVISFIVLVFIILLKMPMKKYWQNLLAFALGFSLSMLMLALASRVDLGYVRGAFDIGFAVSPGKAFLVPFVIIGLDGLLLRLIRQIYQELGGETPKGALATILLGAEEKEDIPHFRRREREDITEPEGKPERIEEPEETQGEEIDIWKELAARPMPNRETDDSHRVLLWNEEVTLPVSSWGSQSGTTETGIEKEVAAESKSQPKAKESKKKRRQQARATAAETQAPNAGEPDEGKSGEISEQAAKQEQKKEVDISLFPSRKKKERAARSWMDFSDMEDELLPEEYEAEEILEDFVEEEESLAGNKASEAEGGQTKVIHRDGEKEDWEQTIPYHIIRK